MKTPMLVVLAVAACAPRVPLAEVPIVGGTAEQRADVAEAVREFEADAGAGRVELTRIELTADLPAEFGGRFAHGADSIRLDQDLHGDLLRRTVRHELCHAIDYAEGLSDRRADPLDALAEELAAGDPAWSQDYQGVATRRREAFAELCEGGPIAAWSAAAGCSGDDPRITALAGFLLDEVWTGSMPAPYALPDVPVASFATTEPIVDADLYGTDQPGVLELQFDTASGTGLAVVDGATGAVLSGVDVAWPQPDLEVPDSWDSTLVGFGPQAGWTDGPAFVVGSLNLARFRLPTLRRFAAGPDGAAPVEPACAGAGEVPFAADDALWTSWLEDGGVRWQPTGLRHGSAAGTQPGTEGL